MFAKINLDKINNNTILKAAGIWVKHRFVIIVLPSSFSLGVWGHVAKDSEYVYIYFFLSTRIFLGHLEILLLRIFSIFYTNPFVYYDCSQNWNTNWIFFFFFLIIWLEIIGFQSHCFEFNPSSANDFGWLLDLTACQLLFNYFGKQHFIFR